MGSLKTLGIAIITTSLFQYTDSRILIYDHRKTETILGWVGFALSMILLKDKTLINHSNKPILKPQTLLIASIELAFVVLLL